MHRHILHKSSKQFTGPLEESFMKNPDHMQEPIS
jgi:hypothetical protein